jgi:hypothetical protein
MKKKNLNHRGHREKKKKFAFFLLFSLSDLCALSVLCGFFFIFYAFILCDCLSGHRRLPSLYRIKLREAQKARGAQGIEAEILFCRLAAKKIGAESPVFLPVLRAKKCAKMTDMSEKSKRRSPDHRQR